MPGALTGLKIVEIGEFISAPYCGKLLADLGADVIKVETRAGDLSRQYGPFRDDIPDPEASGLFVYLNANKRGVTLDPSVPAGRALLGRLLQRADVLIEAVEPDDVDRFGLGWSRLQTENTRLIVTSISTFGRSGPHSHWRGHGLQASAGSTVAQRTGDPNRSPLAKPLNEPEFLGGAHAAAATLVASLFRGRTGKGQHVDVSTQALLAGVTSGPALASILFGTRSLGSRAGHRTTSFYPWTVLPVADGYMEFITMQERHWRLFIEEIGSPAWADDPRFVDKFERVAHADELDALIIDAVKSRTKAELWKGFRERKISFQPVQRIDEVVKSDHLAHRGYFTEVEDGNGKPMTVPGAPYKLSATPWEIRRRAPRLGEHNDEIFGRELKLPEEELAELRTAGVI